MTNKAETLDFLEFSSPSNPLLDNPQSRQARYLYDYLADLHAVVLLKEANYFDRDYLSEFSSFYGTSSKGYPNVCQRLHFFDSADVNRELLESALAGGVNEIQKIQDSYLGFIVLRPIAVARLGRTVLKWYPDNFPETPRVVDPSREYTAHVCGLPLKVRGLAWQQQDTAVSACATVGLWTIFHSSAFDDHHAIPTTVQITKSAHKTASLGARTFPSSGLTFEQICEAIKEQDLSPAIISGNVPCDGTRYFDKTRFCGSLASLIRSSYPVLLIGTLGGNGLHAVVSTGFRSSYPHDVEAGKVGLQDAGVNFVYVHDDNIGPGVRFSIDERDGRVVLKTSPPEKRGQRLDGEHPTESYPEFIPHHMIFAVHNDLRTSPDQLHNIGAQAASLLSATIKQIGEERKIDVKGITFSPRFFKLVTYLNDELVRLLSGRPATLSKVRLELCEKVSPMSLYVGLVRIGLDDSTPLLDILYDTTDSDLNHPVYATVCYGPGSRFIAEAFTEQGLFDFGTLVNAYD